MNINDLKVFLTEHGWNVEHVITGKFTIIYITKNFSEEFCVSEDLEFKNSTWGEVAESARDYVDTYSIMEEFIDVLPDEADSFEQLRPLWEHAERCKMELEALAIALEEKANIEEVR